MVRHLRLDFGPTPPVKADTGHFTYGSRGFRIGNIAREDPARLRLLLFPKGRKEQKRAAEKAERLKASTRAWAEAQCRFYGLDLTGAKTKDDVQQVLKDAVEAGEVRQHTFDPCVEVFAVG